jgi:poly(3-hydroxybutyrate) depolymerase
MRYPVELRITEPVSSVARAACLRPPTAPTSCASDSGQCWSNYNNNIARILKQYDDVLANYCVDTSHVFGIGHSSGAQMLVNILSHKSDAQHLNFRGVSPVAADPFNVAIPMPVLYIDGIMDNQRSADSAKTPSPSSAPPTCAPIRPRRTRPSWAA